AEDGIRDRTVTGVQTCALPIFTPSGLRTSHEVRFAVTLVIRPPVGGKTCSFHRASRTAASRAFCWPKMTACGLFAALVKSGRMRSEERRVGKECRCGGWRRDRQ